MIYVPAPFFRTSSYMLYAGECHALLRPYNARERIPPRFTLAESAIPLRSLHTSHKPH